MSLTEKQAEIIANHSLQGALDHIRAKLRDFTEFEDLALKDVANILSALLLSTAAFNLPSPSGNVFVAVNLLALRQQVQNGEVELGCFRVLVRHVIEKSSDATIWVAVFDLINTLNPSLSPIVPSFNGTPVNSNETREIVEAALFEEIKNCTFRSVGGFCDKFFSPKNWREEQRKMIAEMLAEHDGKRWTGFPSSPDEKQVWDWLRSLGKNVLADAPNKLFTTSTANQFKERKGQMDLFFQIPAATTSSLFKYKHVLVVGEQKKSYDKSRFKADFLQLTRYVRSVFAEQPTRRFVHAFTLCASTMELWVFDRSGAYSSGPFDIHDEPDKLAQAITGYATMGEDAMGRDTFIEAKGGHCYVTLDDVTGGGETRIRLGQPIVRQKAIVSRGTACFNTRNNHVAKFSWVSDKRKLEVEHLQLAKERGVQGVAKVVAHRQITTIAKLREGLQFDKEHRFRSKDAQLNYQSSQTTNASSNKRKSSSNHSSNDASKSKKSQPTSQISKLAKGKDKQLLTSKDRPSLYTPSEELWENRIYFCLVVSPAGRVINDFQTITELLESMRDAIRAHQSLYTTGNILHRDISSNNIIITRPETADGFKGMLIDLDLAKVRDSGPSGARHQTGTMQFMAIEVLRTIDHTYRHDLESFFYVLLWVCARRSWHNGLAGNAMPPRYSLLRAWEIGSFRDIANAKMGNMTMGGLDDIMGEFPEALDDVKQLCQRIRSVLFGDTARLFLGTPAGDPDQLYGPIITAYNDTISQI